MVGKMDPLVQDHLAKVPSLSLSPYACSFFFIFFSLQEGYFCNIYVPKIPKTLTKDI